MSNTTLIFGIALLIATYVYCTIDQTPKHTKNNPYIYWSDTNNPPKPGFEQAVDMYYSTHRDTIYMELSYGPK